MTLAETLESLLPPDSTLRFGEMQLSRTPDGCFRAVHIRNMEADAKLEALESPEALREMAKFDADGEFRPLKTSPTLQCGWKAESDSADEFLQQLDAVYPGVFATWVAYEAGSLDPVPLRETLSRQSGMNRDANAITDQQANRIMRELCSPDCIRKIAWPIDDQCPVSRLKRTSRSIPVICTEACTLAVARASQLVKKEE